jgi:hypothetical protein
MNADAFRQLYDYHFAENRNIWQHVIHLSLSAICPGGELLARVGTKPDRASNERR